MANYKLAETEWLAKEMEKIKSILAHRMEHGKSYSGAALKRLVVDVGLNYTDAEFVQLRDDLVSQGIIESI